MAGKIAQRHQNRPQAPVKIKIRREDTVKVIAGKDKGKTGRVLETENSLSTPAKHFLRERERDRVGTGLPRSSRARLLYLTAWKRAG